MTDEQLREAVARAICVANGRDPDDKIYITVVDAPPRFEYNWKIQLNAADAAIAVMQRVYGHHRRVE